ncbi:MAG: methyltransferase domain-containing protein [Acidobacteriota bacterium]
MTQKPPNAPSDWFEDFFSGFVVEFWAAAVPEEVTREDVEFLWKHLRLSSGTRVLDVPCGDGRLILPLAARGCAMTGVDISQEFLDVGIQAAAKQGLRATFSRSDMRRLPREVQYDAAFCFGNSFGFLDDAGNADFLAAVARALRAGGRFAIDYGQTAESIFPRLESYSEAQVGGFHFVEETRYDPITGRIENRFTLSRHGETQTKLASHRVYTVNEIVRLLDTAGFRVLDYFGSPKEEPFALGSHRLLIVSERASGASGTARQR